MERKVYFCVEYKYISSKNVYVSEKPVLLHSCRHLQHDGNIMYHFFHE